MKSKYNMQESVTTGSLLTLYRQLLDPRSNEYEFILFLEGDSDLKFFRNHINHTKVKLIDSRGKSNAREVINQLNKSYKGKERKPYLAIVDSDFDKVLGKPNVLNMVKTDSHDIEVLILTIDRDFMKLRRAISTYIVNDKFYPHRHKIIHVIFTLSYHIGLMKLYSIQNYCRISFKDIDYGNILDNNLVFDKDELYRRFMGEFHTNYIAFLKGNGYDYNLNESISNLKDINQICNGHDIIKISVFLLENYLSDKSPNCSEFEQTIRIQLSKEELKSTLMYNDLISWIKLKSLGENLIGEEHLFEL